MLKKLAKQTVAKLSPNNYKTLNWIEISKEKTLHNIEIAKTFSGQKNIIAVLKANAYGHGIIPLSKILNESDCSFIAVDGYFEASKIIDTTKHKILVMGYILKENIHLLNTRRCSYVIQDEATLVALGETGKRVNIHVELNTGMNRLGLSETELDTYLLTLKRFPNLHLEGIMSHLADADNDDDHYTAGQVKLFDAMVEKILANDFTPAYIHLGQTAGGIKEKSIYTNTMRLGIGLYGLNPLTKKDPSFDTLQSLVPILEFKTTIIKIIDLKKGEKISYGGTYTTTKNSTIAVVPIGYYEGVPRALSNSGFLSDGKKTFPIRGRVCMNHCMIDITGEDYKVGDNLTFVSSDKTMPTSVEQICLKNKLFNYSFVTGFSESLRRIII